MVVKEKRGGTGDEVKHNRNVVANTQQVIFIFRCGRHRGTGPLNLATSVDRFSENTVATNVSCPEATPRYQLKQNRERGGQTKDGDIY